MLISDIISFAKTKEDYFEYMMLEDCEYIAAIYKLENFYLWDLVPMIKVI